jgi:hypothetical protein
MRTPLLLSLVLSFGILGAAAAVVLRPAERPAAPAADALASSAILERLERLEGGIARLSELEGEIARLSAAQAIAAPVPALETAPPLASTSRQEPVEDAPAGGEAPSKLERWLEASGMREEMETFVAQVYEQARAARQDRERQEAKARQQEVEELSKGPYGRHNYKVNLLSSRLSLDARQTEYLYGLLQENEERSKNLKQQHQAVVTPDRDKLPVVPEQIEQHLQHLAKERQTLAEGLERDFLAALSPGQKETYAELPDHEKVGAGAGRVVFFQPSGDVVGAAAEVLRFHPPLPPTGGYQAASR